MITKDAGTHVLHLTFLKALLGIVLRKKVTVVTVYTSECTHSAISFPVVLIVPEEFEAEA